jgi:hypothetical protein
MSADALAQRLLSEANITVLLVDHGYRTDETWPPAELAARLPCRVLPILRLEVLAQELIVRHESFETLLDAYSASVERARVDGFVGLKSIIAYRTGLAVQPTSRGDAFAAFGPVKERARRDGGVRLATKPLNDYLLLRALEIAERQTMPVQIHTGFGDADLDLREANPLHLRPLLESGQYPNVPFVLLHASYRCVRELGYLAAIYANVYADASHPAPRRRDPDDAAPAAESRTLNQDGVLERCLADPRAVLARRALGTARAGDGTGRADRARRTRQW